MSWPTISNDLYPKLPPAGDSKPISKPFCIFICITQIGDCRILVVGDAGTTTAVGIFRGSIKWLLSIGETPCPPAGQVCFIVSKMATTERGRCIFIGFPFSL
ncbi:MAG: hypothetical protein IPO78_16465 [Saprospiraceae bacterium]|nr:hypothetical protein [Saprospiraceae bacterium]